MKCRIAFSMLGLVALALVAGACGRGMHVIETTPAQPMGDGTVSGIVSSASGSPLVNRLVTAVDQTTDATHTAQTNTAGGYTLKLPPGTYRFEVELRAGERLAKRPDPITLEVGEIETRVDFVIA